MLNQYRLWAILATAILAKAAHAAPRAHTMTLHEKRYTNTGATSQWDRRNRVDQQTVVPVRIGLTQNNLAAGEAQVARISDPKSPSYGQFYTADEVHALFAPSPESVVAVLEWLIDSGIDAKSIVTSDHLLSGTGRGCSFPGCLPTMDLLR